MFGRKKKKLIQVTEYEGMPIFTSKGDGTLLLHDEQESSKTWLLIFTRPVHPRQITEALKPLGIDYDLNALESQ